MVWAAAAAAAAAQEPDPSETAARAGRELRCLESAEKKLTNAIDLLRDARAQARSASVRDRARRDAAKAIVALERRIGELTDRLAACIEPGEPDGHAPAAGERGAQVRRGGDGRRVVYVEAPPDPAVEAVAEPGSAIDVVDRDRRLSTHVRVKTAQRVDGHGKVDAQIVRRSVSGISARLERCYARLVDDGALERGTASMVFTVTSRGRVEDVQTEQVGLGDGRFRRCLHMAGRTLRVQAAARGGDATYSYRFQFGPDD